MQVRCGVPVVCLPPAATEGVVLDVAATIGKVLHSRPFSEIAPLNHTRRKRKHASPVHVTAAWETNEGTEAVN